MIRITDDYVIDVDSLNFTVKKDKHKMTIDKDGNEKPAFDNVGHFITLENALKCVRNELFRNKISDVEIDLESAIKEFKKTNDEFVSVFKKAVNDFKEVSE